MSKAAYHQRGETLDYTNTGTGITETASTNVLAGYAVADAAAGAKEILVKINA